MVCNNCGKNFPIVNKHFNLCLICNKRRLEDLKKNSVGNIPKGGIKSIKTSKKRIEGYNFVKSFVNKKSTKEKIEEDEAFYEKCFNSVKEHKCEECGCELPDRFRDDENNVIARWRYSHIIPKSINKNLRHELSNINHLCLKDHKQWENGNKEIMNIYEKNKKLFPNYF